MKESTAGVIIFCTIAVCSCTLLAIGIWTASMERIAQINAGQKVEQQIRKHIDLGVYDEKSNTFTLPDGRVIAAPITNESKIEITK